MGSIETTDYDKRQFAFQSLEFNLRDKQFCDLFPEVVTTIQVKLKPNIDGGGMDVFFEGGSSEKECK